jgi:hypothetical protein
MKKILFGILLIGTLFSATSTQSLSFQGKLLDNSGVAVNGVRSMTFTLYPQATGGTSVPNAMWSQSVNVQNGIYAVELDASAVDLTIVSEAWMEVTVAGETLSPRIHLTSSTFAQRASTANYAVAAGTVSPNGFFMGTAPIIESGSVGNDSWIKYADGTMVCAGTGVSGTLSEIANAAIGTYGWSFYYGVVSITFARSFVASPAITTSFDSGTATAQTITNTGFALVPYSYRTIPARYSYIAVGRWK